MHMYQKIVFDRYYCTKTFCHTKILKNSGKIFQKNLFSCTYDAMEKHITSKCFENAALLCSGAHYLCRSKI